MYCRYITFEVQTYWGNKKTSTWSVVNKRAQEIIGIISWYPGWRQYCFFPSNDTVFSAGCLKDIEAFIERQMEARKS